MTSDSATLVPTQQSVKAYVDTTVAATNEVVEDSTPQLGGDLDTNGNDILFADNDKAIFGASSDLQIYHNGTRSIIADTGTGNLQLRTSSLAVVNAAGTEVILQGDENGAASLYYDASKKLNTTSTGIDVTGTLTVEGASAGRVNLGTFTNSTNAANTEASISLQNNQVGCSVNLVADRTGANFGSDFYIENADNAGALKKRLNVSEIGDISFYEDTGSTQALFWDASAESLGIGTTSPSGDLHIKGTSFAQQYIQDNGTVIRLIASGGVNYIQSGTAISTGSAAPLAFGNINNNTEFMRLDTSGRLGIGTIRQQLLYMFTMLLLIQLQTFKVAIIL